MEDKKETLIDKLQPYINYALEASMKLQALQISEKMEKNRISDGRKESDSCIFPNIFMTTKVEEEQTTYYFKTKLPNSIAEVYETYTYDDSVKVEEVVARFYSLVFKVMQTREINSKVCDLSKQVHISDLKEKFFELYKDKKHTEFGPPKQEMQDIVNEKFLEMVKKINKYEK